MTLFPCILRMTSMGDWKLVLVLIDLSFEMIRGDLTCTATRYVFVSVETGMRQVGSFYLTLTKLFRLDTRDLRMDQVVRENMYIYLIY